jgi:type II restriction enzyme
LTPGDEKLNKLTEIMYPIIKILRDQVGENIEYILHDKYVEIIKGDDIYSIDSKFFIDNVDLLFNEIKNPNNSGAFEIPGIEKFLKLIKCTKLKAKSSDKTDIKIVIHDIKQNFQKELGFSIKSQLGSPSTLFNAGVNTNFIYHIEQYDLKKEQVDCINNISPSTAKIKKRLE